MSRRLPQLTALRAFEAAARHLSFAKAAKELHVTPAAVSQQIKQLEEYLGVSLFRRGKRIALSDAAASVLPLLSEGFDRLERAVEILRIGNDGGPLVVSTPPAFAARWLVSRLDDFQARHPDIEIHLHASRRLVDFAVKNVDVAIRFGSGDYPGLHVERLMPEAIVPVATAELAKTIRKPADLLNCTLLIIDDGNPWELAFPDWETWLASLGVTGKKLRLRRFSDSNLVVEAVTAGQGVALMWYSLVANDLHTGRLKRLFGSTLPTEHGYHLVTLPNRLQVPKIAAFRHWMLEQASRQDRLEALA